MSGDRADHRDTTVLQAALMDGAAVRGREKLACDVAVVGSGPAGASAARVLARAGARVIVFEEGPFARFRDFPSDGFTAMAKFYRDMGASVLMGNAPMPFLQGRAVGGGSVINGAISWRLPRDVYDEWVLNDPAIGDAIPWDEIDAATDEIEKDLNVLPTDDAVAGPNNLLMAKGAEALGLEHRRISRYTRGCRGLGRCLQGCPEGNRLSMDLTYLADACAHGARVLSSVEVGGILVRDGRAAGIVGRASGGGTVTCEAGRAVVLAASAVQTPVLLMKNGLRHGPVGLGFQGHPGTSMIGWFGDPVRVWTGATQGHEVTGMRKEGLKFEALGYDIAVAAARLKSAGRAFAEEIRALDHWAAWGACVRAKGRGRVGAGFGRASVRFSLLPEDVFRLRRGVRVLGEMMLAAGAEFVTPGVHGWHDKVAQRAVMARFEEEGPLDPRAYTMVLTHMFGTCRMGADPSKGVVRPDFRHHAVDGLYVADSSVFPTNTGVNPQTSIMALATICGRRIAAGTGQ
ncbi:MAG: GMC family oxidoreductase [Deltaproteobacteria bacterium]|nr:GMC family oxidoreductase [Deltaproteobacteria bacterium]